MRAKTVGFAIADEDRDLLESLVKKYGNGNRSEFLRVAMKMMAKIEMADRINSIREEVRGQLGGKMLTADEIDLLIRKVKGKSVE